MLLPSTDVPQHRVFLAAIVGFLAFTSSLQAGYLFQNIIDPGDPTFNQALGVNNAGTVSGYFGSGAAGHPNQGYTVAPPGYTSFTNENFPGSVQTQVVGINNSGVTVGFWSNTNLGSGDANYGFTDVGGTFTSVSNPATPATGTPVNQLLGVNDNKVAAGFYVDGSGNNQGYLYNFAGSPTFSPVTVLGASNSVATDVNNAGVISGFYTNGGGSDVAFIDNAGVFTFFQASGDSTMFFGLNNTGNAVGTYVDATGQFHGVLYNIASNTYQTIDDPLAASGAGNGTTLNGINDKNQLVGFYVNGDGNTIGLIATIPEPASFALTGLGLAIAAWRRRARSRG